MSLYDELQSAGTGEIKRLVYPSLDDVKAQQEDLALFFNEVPEAWAHFYQWRQQNQDSSPMAAVVNNYNIQ
jgi:hypothetical protein